MRVEIRDVYKNVFTFRFFDEQDRVTILNDSPWFFQGSLVVLQGLKHDESPIEVNLDHVLLWVQAHYLPRNMCTKVVAKTLGNFLGRFVKWDTNDLGNCIRFRAWVDISNPLKRGTLIEGCRTHVSFIYERLGNFCYECGNLDNTLKYSNLPNKARTLRREEEKTNATPTSQAPSSSIGNVNNLNKLGRGNQILPLNKRKHHPVVNMEASNKTPPLQKKKVENVPAEANVDLSHQKQ